MSDAIFSGLDHCTKPGFATYGLHHRRHLRCLLFGCSFDRTVPVNDYCPQSYRRCRRCRTPFRWFDIGTHRYGGMSAPRPRDQLSAAVRAFNCTCPEGERT